MTQTNVNVQMQIRRDTAANWQSNNTTLLDGEWGYVKDTNIFKIGNGSTQFNFLPEAILSSNGSYSSPLFISNYHLKITSQKELRFSDDVDGATGEHYSSFKAGSQSANINYTLPTTAPTDNQYLKCSAAGVLSWDTFTGTDIADLVSNDANNRILTATGTKNSFNAEANLTFDGSTLAVTGAITSTGNITITNDAPKIFLTDASNNPDFSLQNANGAFVVFDDTNSASRLEIDGNGNVGIGSAPDRKLHVKSSGLIAKLESTSETSAIMFATPNNESAGTIPNIGATSNDLTFTTGNLTRLTINSAGNVGIGTTSPNRLIHGVGASPILKLDSTNNEAYVQFVTASPSNTFYIGIVDSDIILQSSGASSTTSENLRIKANGRVSINAQTPVATLHVSDPNGDNVTAFFHTTATANYIQLSDSQNAHSYIAKENNGNLSQVAFYASTSTGNGTGKAGHFDYRGLVLPANKGINFSPYDDPYSAPPATTNNSNRLDDYEEGNFTPAITATGTDPTQTYQGREGSYIKIGRVVHISVDIEFASSGISGGTNEAVVSNLPFPKQNTSRHYGITMAVGYSPNWGGTSCPTGGYINPNATFVYLLPYNSNGIEFSQASQIGNGTRLIAGFTYMTNA